MRADNVHIEGNSEYTALRVVPASPGERDPGGGAVSPRDGSLLPALYKRKQIKSAAACIVNLSSRDSQTPEKDYPVLQAFFDPADKAHEDNYRFYSWERTVAGILGVKVRKGLYINLLV